MSAVTLDMFKQQCRVDDLEQLPGEEQYMQQLLDTAEAWVVNVTRRSIAELTETGGGTLPLPLKQAILMLGAHWYNQREAVGHAAQAEVPYTLSTLVKPYIRLI